MLCPRPYSMSTLLTRITVAIQDIHKDEDLFSLSRADFLSVENSDFIENDAGRQLVAQVEDQWISLILVMIYEFLQGEQSLWKPYFDILPADFNSLMFWGDDELDQLQASAVRQKIGKDEATRTFLDKVVAPVRANQSLFPNAASLSDMDLLVLAHRMGSTIMAYAFDIEKDPSQQEMDEDGFAEEEDEALLPKAMVAMADLLNADAVRDNAHLFYGKDTVTMRAIKPIKAGEEILNDYGALPRADLLRRYGYITNNYAQYDVVEMPRQLVIDVYRANALENDPASPYEQVMYIHSTKSDLTDDLVEPLLEYLDEYDVLDDGYDISRDPEDDLFPPLLRNLMWALDLTAAEVSEKRASKPRKATLDVNEKDSVRFLGILCHILQARMAQYPTSLDDDMLLAQQLDQSPPQNTSDLRKAMALHVRIGEKHILLDAFMKTSQAHNEAVRRHAPQA